MKNYHDAMKAAKATVNIATAIAAFEITFGITFPWDQVKKDVAKLKAAMLKEL